MPTIKVTYSEMRSQHLAEALATKLNLPLVDHLQMHQDRGQALPAGYDHDYYLDYAANGLCLMPSERADHGPIRCDFTSGATAHRRKHGGGNGQAIAKAVGVSGKFSPKILDLTAGMGGDSFVLASLGCHMQLLERNPIVHSLLYDGLQRAAVAGKEDSELGSIIDRIDLFEGDALGYLQERRQEPCADVIYLDPMFPERKKAPRLKKRCRRFMA